MVDSESVAVGREVAAWLTDRFVVPEAGGEGQQSLRDAGDDAAERARPVALERELLLERLEDRLDPLPGAAERPEARLLVLAVGAHQATAVVGDEALEVAAREALVAEHDAPLDRDPLEDLGRRPALGNVGRRELEADRHALRGAEQKQPKAPEEARVRAAVAVAGVACQLGATRGLARLAARNGGRVEQPEPIAEAGRGEREQVD